MTTVTRMTLETLPTWLQTSTAVALPDLSNKDRRRGKTAYIDKILLRAATALKALLESGSAAKANGLMQSVGARQRLVGTVAILMAAAVTGSLTVLFSIGLLLLLIALLSKVRLRTLFFRVAPVVLFAAVVTAPSLFGFGGAGVTDNTGTASLLAFSVFGLFFDIGFDALYAASFLVTRVTVMVLATTLLLLTTTRTALFTALGSLPLPSSFVTLLQMTYRHLLILLSHVQEAALARRARTIEAPQSRDLREWFASRVGLMLMRSLATAEEVSQAMASRGFNGRAGGFKPVGNFGTGTRARAVDSLWLLFAFFLFFIALGT